MIVYNLSSGSKGNCTFVQTKKHKILIDIGNSCLYVEKKLREIGVEPDDIDLVLITHAHVDHVSGVRVFCKKHNPEIYISDKIIKEANIDKHLLNRLDMLERIEDIKITELELSHDVEDIKGYIIEEGSSSMVYITDTGYINEKYFKKLKNRNIYVFESNHDVEMLMNNEKYPHTTKIRILSDKGHLSNKDSSYYLSKLIGDDTKVILLSHLSEQNNKEELAINTLIETLKRKKVRQPEILTAKQNMPSRVFKV